MGQAPAQAPRAHWEALGLTGRFEARQRAVRTISSRAFNQDTGQTKKAAIEGPVIVTDRGRPSHVLLTYESYRRRLGEEPSIGELMYVPGAADIELELPSRSDDLSREADFT